MNWTTPTPENLADLVERHAGKSGGPEAETIARWSKSDGCVSIWSCVGSHISNIVKRNPGAIRRFREDGGGVCLEVQGRPPWMLVSKAKGEPMSEEAKAALRERFKRETT